MTELTKQQNEALTAIARWYRGAQQADGFAPPFRLFGPAGTGKTTLAKQVPEALDLTLFGDSGVQYGAYTGKAANVLRLKGCTPASTLHSLVYIPMPSPETYARLQDAQRLLSEGIERGEGQDWIDELQVEIRELEKQSRVIGFEWNPDSVLADCPLLILDEVSMVDAKLAADIERFNVPVLVLGDPEQLEPVGGEGYYTDAEPDYALSEIHRQALDSPVLELATRIRLSTDSRFGLTEADLSRRSVSLAMEHDQVLCWKNSTRWRLISMIRGALGRPAGQVVPGDRIMCLTNNKTMGIFNGQQFEVFAAEPGTLGPRLLVADDTGVRREILAFQSGFEGQAEQDSAKKNYLGGRGNRGLFTFAQAITVHKSQGSEWPSVYVVNEAPDLMAVTAKREGATAACIAARRWLYTAVSRASEKVTITG